MREVKKNERVTSAFVKFMKNIIFKFTEKNCERNCEKKRSSGDGLIAVHLAAMQNAYYDLLLLVSNF